jgi:hypothetical protein
MGAAEEEGAAEPELEELQSHETNIAPAPQREPGPGPGPHAPEPLAPNAIVRPDISPATPPPPPSEIATEEVPGSVTRSMVDQDMATRFGTPMRSAMDYAAQIQPPPFRPFPQRPPIEPGFRGALKDFARGMIPGYTAGKESVFQEQVAQDAAQRKYEMDVYKQQMGMMKPLLTKDYATQNWIQEVEMKRAYLKARYGWMTEPEIAARSTGTHYTPPTKPKPGEPKEFHFMPGVLPKSLDPTGEGKIVVMWSQQAGGGAGGWVAPGGQEIPNQLMNQATEVGKESGQGPHYIENARPPGSNQPPGVMVVPKPGAAAVQVENVEKVPRPIDPEMQALLKTQRQVGIDVQRQNLRNQQSLALTPRQEQTVSSNVRQWETQMPYKAYQEKMGAFQDALNMNPKSAIEQLGMIFALNKAWDANSVVREGEVKTALQYASSVSTQLVLAVTNLFERKELMRPQDLQKLLMAVRARVISASQQFHANRSDRASRLGQQLGTPIGSRFADPYAHIEMGDPKRGLAGWRIARENTETGEIDEFIKMPDGTYLMVEK